MPVTATLTANDYGFENLAAELPEPDEALLRAPLDPAELMRDALAAVNGTEMARRRFREIARVAGMVFEGYPAVGKSARQIQASSGLIFDVLSRYDPGHLLTAQALEEVLEQQLDLPRAALAAIADGTVAVRATLRLTPLAFPLWAERIGSRVSSGDVATRVARMAEQLARAADRRRTPMRRAS